MLIAALLSAAVVAAGVPPSAGLWVSPDDYPMAAVRDGRGGITGFRLTVSPKGKPLACEIERSSGWDDLDAQSCRSMMKRARFEPARDAQGVPSFAIYRNLSKWWIPDGAPIPQNEINYDLALSVTRLPEGIDDLSVAMVAFAVSADGMLSDCTPMLPQPAAPSKSNKSRMEHLVVEKLGNVACSQALLQLKPKAAHDIDGAPVASVQVARVLFQAGP